MRQLSLIPTAVVSENSARTDDVIGNSLPAFAAVNAVVTSASAGFCFKIRSQRISKGNAGQCTIQW
jgi:hypothetical protein